MKNSGLGTNESPVNKTVEWFTPKLVFDSLDIKFNLDPCYPENLDIPYIPVNKVYRPSDNGLVQPWEGRVWLNPPFGREIKPWLDKMILHKSGIAITAVRSDNVWFHNTIRNCDAIYFIRGRIGFLRDGKPIGGGLIVALYAWDNDCVEALRNCKLPGTFLMTNNS